MRLIEDLRYSCCLSVECSGNCSVNAVFDILQALLKDVLKKYRVEKRRKKEEEEEEAED